MTKKCEKPVCVLVPKGIDVSENEILKIGKLFVIRKKSLQKDTAVRFCVGFPSDPCKEFVNGFVNELLRSIVQFEPLKSKTFIIPWDPHVSR